MHIASRVRHVLARHPWIYWGAVALLATIAATVVHGEMNSIAAARARWGTSRTVMVAGRSLEPGDPAIADPMAVPIAAIPDHALHEIPTGAVVRQRVAQGEVLTELDVTSRVGPAALAEAGTVVVALADPLARDVSVGLVVQVSADGVLVADAAVVTGIVDEVTFVAVSERDGPVVAAAAQQGTASLLYLP